MCDSCWNLWLPWPWGWKGVRGGAPFVVPNPQRGSLDRDNTHIRDRVRCCPTFLCVCMLLISAACHQLSLCAYASPGLRIFCLHTLNIMLHLGLLLLLLYCRPCGANTDNVATSCSNETMMNAITIEKFGGPEVLQLKRVPKPLPGPNQVQVQLFASGVNPVET